MPFETTDFIRKEVLWASAPKRYFYQSVQMDQYDEPIHRIWMEFSFDLWRSHHHRCSISTEGIYPVKISEMLTEKVPPSMMTYKFWCITETHRWMVNANEVCTWFYKICHELKMIDNASLKMRQRLSLEFLLCLIIFCCFAVCKI